MTFYKKCTHEFSRYMFWYLDNYVGFHGNSGNYLMPLFLSRKYRNKLK